MKKVKDFKFVSFKNFDINDKSHTKEEIRYYKNWLHRNEIKVKKKEASDRKKAIIAKNKAERKAILAVKRSKHREALRIKKENHRKDMILREMNRDYKKQKYNNNIMNIKIDDNLPAIYDYKTESKKYGIHYLGNSYNQITINFLMKSLRGVFRKEANSFMDNVKNGATYEDYDKADLYAFNDKRLENKAVDYLKGLAKEMDSNLSTNAMKGLAYEIHRFDLVTNGQFGEHQASVYRDSYAESMRKANIPKQYSDAISKLSADDFMTLTSLFNAKTNKPKNADLPMINEYYPTRDFSTDDSLRNVALNVGKALLSLDTNKYSSIFNNDGSIIDANDDDKKLRRQYNRLKIKGDFKNYREYRRAISSLDNSLSDRDRQLSVLKIRDSYYKSMGRTFIKYTKYGRQYIPFVKREISDYYIAFRK